VYPREWSARLTARKLGIPDLSTSYVSTSARKLVGNASAYEVNAAC